ncbi:MAG: transferase [Pseudodesulfovibrio sp.]|uniref:Transferase hexapeptide repeat containing protein n=1 Tax=Pseudodesulfovibrio aespoeensis (strain ATCC 700646 / DSM 10631 / Aspo-2) TaxID=643562 RepID=E6VT58_PSEA9|nr:MULTISPECIES: transferase [Pseudodesulfovibrio]MBU4378128.1 transferase [Pseudomonadota bacterium]ADU62108.1 transferase hexapeptide repeat containing protein [Pseudodesulfovibrio aespoeensis Aspo-2]MBU4474615.1 transferase [Pseudomonadota bacterium]MBU4515921.1 transferase [Pseudomonadota bacterium]MBU4522877.1 transferase [Pseudomonadota bacterium]
MEKLEELLTHITSRININLKPMGIDVEPILKNAIPRERHLLYYAFYALTTDHPLSFRFTNSSLGGTYFLGKTLVDRSVLYKSDIRGDELKRKGDVVEFDGIKTKLFYNEVIRIINSYLVKTLVHNYSHNPEIPEVFKILNTVAMHYSNIHGTTTEGVFLGPFATVDFSYMHNCVVGEYAYVQAGDLSRQVIEPGRVWIRYNGLFEFNYIYPEGVLKKYISMDENGSLSGEFFDHVDERKEDFLPIYSSISPEPFEGKGDGAYVSPYAVLKGNCTIGDNALVAQRAHVEDSVFGNGSNAQENCYIMNSVYEGLDITAHGAKVINTRLGNKVFVGFNSFLHGKKPEHITVGRNSIVMPHTIIDSDEPIAIPENSMVWGHVTCQADLATQCMTLDAMSAATDITMGNMTFKGDGKAFVDAFRERIEHILEANGAYYNGTENTRGHAQKTQDACFNILQPFQSGPEQGMYPSMTIGD